MVKMAAINSTGKYASAGILVPTLAKENFHGVFLDSGTA
jgi:hypothetical protein